MRTARLRGAHPVLRSGRSGWFGWAGWVALAAGAVLCVVGWYGVSGERFAARQLPYIASGTVPGAALIVAGAVLLAHSRDTVSAARLEELYGLLAAAGSAVQEEDEEQRPSAGPVAVSGETLMVPGGTLYHRADCPLVAGKADALPVDGRLLAGGELGPCPVCEPDSPDSGDG
ncbi:hypothetical protein [Streptomyces sp. YIM S03343]